MVIFIISHTNMSGKCMIKCDSLCERRRENYHHFWSEGMHVKNYHSHHIQTLYTLLGYFTGRVIMTIRWYNVENCSCWMKKSKWHNIRYARTCPLSYAYIAADQNGNSSVKYFEVWILVYNLLFAWMPFLFDTHINSMFIFSQAA